MQDRIHMDSESGAMAPALALSRLLQLASPMLPVGAYSYSQGLEWGIEAGAVTDAASAQRWIGDVLELTMGSFELPILARLRHCWETDDETGLAHWNKFFSVARETSEARAETLQMGYSLTRLLEVLEDFDQAFCARLTRLAPLTFPLVYAGAATVWQIPADAGAQAYAWSWLENQVGAAMKTVPLGQVAGQRILLALGAKLPIVVTRAKTLADDELSNFAPGLTLASCRHETQYSRLFRS